MSIYHKAKILIIGGTGTIGQHLLKHLLKENPQVIRILSRDEHKQFELHQQYYQYNNIRYLIGDVRDEQRLVRAMEDIDYVFHLAAMKHVPACEYNPFEAVKTNVIGTQNVIQAATQTGVKRVLFTSTDKAIAPANTYGATKLTAERLISAADYQKGPKQTIFCSVRFGNVMGSRGSVIPLFKKQILEEQEVKVTDSNMLRYMMTPTQAIQLILKAIEMAFGGEVFVLKMPVVKLGDLVDVMKEEADKKFSLNKGIKIKTIGLRPGEKQYEELMTYDEAQNAIEIENMFIIQSPYTNMASRNYGQVHSVGQELKVPSHEDVVSKEKLRRWLLEENLL